MTSVTVYLMLLCALCFVRGKGEDCKFINLHDDDGPHSAVSILDTLKGQSFSTSDPKDAIYRYDIGICTVLDDCKKENCGAVQHIDNPDPTKIEHKSLGNISQADFMTGNNWVKLDYHSGTKYGSHCGNEGRSTVLMIICDPKEKQGKLELIEENKNKTAECYYLFELSHYSVCSATKDTPLGVGSIVTIVFFSLVGAYLLFGFLYQRFVARAQGREQIPHLAFWQDVGNLAADGCDFAFRSNSRGSGGSERQYRGIGDDQLRGSQPDTPSEDVDEHLLPM